MRGSMVGLLGSCLTALLVLPLGATAPDDVRAARQLTAQDIAAACAEQTANYEEMIRLQQRQALVRQIVANYGFQNTSAEFDASAEYLTGRQLARKPPPPRKQLYDETVSRGKKELKSYIETLQRTPDAVGGVMPQFLEVMRKLPMPSNVRDRIIRLASDPATRLSGYGSALEWIDTFMLPVELMEAAEDGALPLAWKGFMEAVSVVSPSYGAFLKVAEWSMTNLYDAVRGQWTAHQIDVLTRSTEADLQSLRQRTDELKTVAQRLAFLNARSPVLAQRCDTSRLTRARQDPPPEQPKASGGSSASAATRMLVIGGLTAAGSYAALKYLAPKDCGDAPLADYYALCPGGAGCSSVKREYGEWCVCTGYRGFDGNACY